MRLIISVENLYNQSMCKLKRNLTKNKIFVESHSQFIIFTHNLPKMRICIIIEVTLL